MGYVVIFTLKQVGISSNIYIVLIIFFFAQRDKQALTATIKY